MSEFTPEFLRRLADAEEVMAKQLGALRHWDTVNTALTRAQGFRDAAKAMEQAKP